MNRTSKERTPGENFMMPYRITMTAPDGSKSEWNATQVRDWTLRLLEQQQNSNSDINVNIPNGTNVAYMISLAYRLGSISNK